MIIEMRLHNMGSMGWVSEQRAEGDDMWTPVTSLMTRQDAAQALRILAGTNIFALGHTVTFRDDAVTPLFSSQTCFRFGT